jgi:hypothetical protein
MDDRRYRQQGYRKPAGANDRRSEPRRPFTPPGEAPRPGSMLASKTVSRCGACGGVLPIANASLEQCPQCRAPMHACLQCAHFDAGKRFECSEPVSERIPDKHARNTCPTYSLRVTVEKQASPDSTRPGDIRRGFDNLFKK